MASGTCLALSGASAGVGLLSFLAGVAISPAEVGKGDSIYILPFQLAGALLGGLLEWFGGACGIAALAFGILGFFAFRSARAESRSQHLAHLADLADVAPQTPR